MSTCPQCGAGISVTRLFRKGPFRYDCTACGKKSRPVNGHLISYLAPGIFVLLCYYLTIFLVWPRVDSKELLWSVLIMILSINFLASLLVVRYGRFVSME
jgi:uncharacterized protein (DUF983 family)